MAQADADVEFAGAHRVRDRGRPQHTRITGIGVVVGQFTDHPRRGHQTVGVLQVGQRHRGGAHQRPVAAAAPALPVHLGGLGARGGRRDTASARGGEHRPGLDADIFGARSPIQPARGDRVLGGLVTQVRAGGGDLGDRDGHRGVIGPLPGLPPLTADHGHLTLRPQGRPKLVRRPQRVAGSHPQQDPLNTIAS